MALDPATRADLANAVLSNQAFKDAFIILEKRYVTEMIATDPHEVEERNYRHICLLVLNDVKTALTAQLQDGKIETVNATLQERAKNDGSGTKQRDKRTARGSNSAKKA